MQTRGGACRPRVGFKSPFREQGPSSSRASILTSPYFTTVVNRPLTTGSRSFCSQSVSSTMRLKSVTRT